MPSRSYSSYTLERVHDAVPKVKEYLTAELLQGFRKRYPLTDGHVTVYESDNHGPLVWVSYVHQGDGALTELETTLRRNRDGIVHGQIFSQGVYESMGTLYATDLDGEIVVGTVDDPRIRLVLENIITMRGLEGLYE